MGIYQIAKQLPPKSLTDFYGAGAFPLDYPNEWIAPRDAAATASGCTACLPTLTAARPAPATAAWW